MKTTVEDYRTEQSVAPERDCQEESIQEAMKKAAERVEKGFEAVKEAVSDTLVRGERLLRRGRNAAESYLEDADHQLRHNPRSAIAMAIAVGAIAGGLFVLLAPRGKLSENSNEKSA
jgi:ElaB/YqjD/DUF883 family membrane-anchored ribosome-binding protein